MSKLDIISPKRSFNNSIKSKIASIDIKNIINYKLFKIDFNTIPVLRVEKLKRRIISNIIMKTLF